MENSNDLWINLITIFGSLLVVALSYWFTNLQKRQAEWRELKIKHYDALLSAISDLVHTKNEDDFSEMGKAFNSLSLVAKPDVINTLIDFVDWRKDNDHNLLTKEFEEKQNEILTRLLLCVRKDLHIKSDNFRYKLIRVHLKKIK
ncbi:hypothetical protein SDC9_53424 [bioreactor metagenome]|jgi:hypothetical protein|uniref:Uncharacterized protein n=2 Tax=root TaxID=1 RepID=A0AB33HR48_9CHLR|nr:MULTISPECIES: hypothetical protein [Dehalococcoides]AQU02570.1 hypothetical protein B1773_00455 [Dehalococcoides mccartyi]MEA4878667.1 hypothetical protein [Dehalococcoides mccartyi]BAZ96728.1 hypothetical protein DEHALATV1_0100 [Dehalococcoides mccartyi]